jgi:hydrogenase expression/formation protein HypE
MPLRLPLSCKNRGPVLAPMPSTKALPAGKLPAELLRAWLERIAPADPSVVVGPGVGEDAAVLDLGAPELLVAKTDPITFAARQPARYLLAVNSNDLAVTGARPRWLLITALLPEGISPSAAEAIFDELKQACDAMGILLVGGHTEMTVGLDRPILVGCLLGTVPRDRLVRTSGAKPGDAILLAGGIAIEGAAILATEHADRLRQRGVPEDVLRNVARWLESPGISVAAAAGLLVEAGGVHAMHDPTEGGLITALHELAEASGIGLRIRRDAIRCLRSAVSFARRSGWILWGCWHRAPCWLQWNPRQPRAPWRPCTGPAFPAP